MPDLNKVYKMVTNEERQRLVTGTRESTSEAAVFMARGETGHGGKRGRFRDFQQNPEGRLVCAHCDKLGHSKNTCWALIGYPSWHSKSKTNAGKGPGHGQTKPRSGPRAKPHFQQGPDCANMA
ncbi:hypothetical protein CRG98_035628 [Punica granatum]|uniref:CCHC-type domain-containing protein n=1 Tax=Punica granatum TaxID=22663 RepID=A0A2I0IJ03_PUNGR|nr:hypothetical protein CRG98_035628 [Punica granatum]